MITRRRLAGLAAATALSSGLRMRTAAAQAWPSRHLRLIVPFVPGGATDAIARTVGHRLSEVWGQQVVIENKRRRRRQYRRRDGRAVGARRLHDAASARCRMAINRFLYPLAQLRPGRRLRAGLADLPAAQPHGGAELLAREDRCMEFIAHAKANAGKISYRVRPASAPRCICPASCSSA